MMKPIVVYRERYLPHSETFIYEQLVHMKRYKPYILCRVKLPSHKEFPYPRVYRIKDVPHIDQQLLRLKVNLIYARFGMGGVKMLPLKHRTQLPLLTSFHGSDVSRQLQLRPDYRTYLPLLFHRGEAFTVVCEYMKKKLVELGCPPAKIRVIKSGIDLKKFPFLPKYNVRDDRIRILSVGRLTEKKGMIDLLRSYRLVLTQYPHAKLIIVGDGEDRKKIEWFIHFYRLESHIELKGRLSHEQVQREMEQCDLFVMASKTASDGNEEGIPNVIMEAMATGRVVIATHHAGIPELIINGETGYLVEQYQPATLAQTIVYALKHRDNWEPMIYKARTKVEEEHDAKKQTEKLEELMDKLIGSSRSVC